MSDREKVSDERLAHFAGWHQITVQQYGTRNMALSLWNERYIAEGKQ